MSFHEIRQKNKKQVFKRTAKRTDTTKRTENAQKPP